MKALVGAFNQEKALVTAFSVIVKPVMEPMEHCTALLHGDLPLAAQPRPQHQPVRHQTALPQRLGQPRLIRGHGQGEVRAIKQKGVNEILWNTIINEGAYFIYPSCRHLL